MRMSELLGRRNRIGTYPCPFQLAFFGRRCHLRPISAKMNGSRRHTTLSASTLGRSHNFYKLIDNYKFTASK